MRKSILTLSILIVASHSWGATLYLNPTGANGEYGNLQAAMAAMSSGDTLIVRDGTYTGEANIINSDTNQDPPNGSSSNYTVIKAEHDGGVFFDGEYARIPVILFACSYIRFEGILWGRSSGDVAAIGYVPDPPGHIKFLRCGFRDAQQFNPTSATGGNCVVVGTTDRVLFEDCYCYGNYRYGFYAGKNGFGIIFRRCVARTDSCNTTTDNSAFNVYDAQNVELQNCITIDINNPANYYLRNNVVVAPRNYMVRDTAEGYDTTGIYFRGCIALNNTNGLSFFQTSGGVMGAEFIDSVFWDTYYGAWCRQGGISFNHCTIGDVYGTNVDVSASHGIYIEMGSDPVTNTIIYGIQNETAAQGNGAYAAGDYNYFYNNPSGNYEAWTPGANDETTIDPMAGSLEYLVRIENGSSYSGAASDSGDIGATILYQYGVSGTFWGEPGYNTLTSTPLWPFPNEALIKTKMAEYTYDDGSGDDPEISGARGFCAPGTRLDGVNPITLTSYIWEYLGNEIPADIYGAGPVHDAPTITGPNDFSTTSASVEIEGTYTVDSELTADTVTWTLGESSGLCVAALGVFSCTVPVELGANSIVFAVTDSNSGTANDTTVVTRTAVPQASITNTSLSHGVLRH